jgi:hypothetical protein
VLIAPAWAARVEPIYNVIDHPIPAAAQKLPLDDIGRNIMIAGLQRHWRFDPVAPGELRGTNAVGDHSATIKVTYTQRSYSISLVQSANLDQAGDNIHRRYNGWIHYLEKDIEDQFLRVGLGG